MLPQRRFARSTPISVPAGAARGPAITFSYAAAVEARAAARPALRREAWVLLSLIVTAIGALAIHDIVGAPLSVAYAVTNGLFAVGLLVFRPAL